MSTLWLGDIPSHLGGTESSRKAQHSIQSAWRQLAVNSIDDAQIALAVCHVSKHRTKCFDTCKG